MHCSSLIFSSPKFCCPFAYYTCCDWNAETFQTNAQNIFRVVARFYPESLFVMNWKNYMVDIAFAIHSNPVNSITIIRQVQFTHTVQKYLQYSQLSTKCWHFHKQSWLGILSAVFSTYNVINKLTISKLKTSAKAVQDLWSMTLSSRCDQITI